MKHAPSLKVYEAIQTWRQECLLDEGSVFTNESLWNKDGFELLNTHYVENLDEGAGTFLEKLEWQLSNAPKNAQKLAAEVFWVMYLYPVSSAIRPSTKADHIKKIWRWSGGEFPEGNPDAIEALEFGSAILGRRTTLIGGWNCCSSS